MSSYICPKVGLGENILGRGLFAIDEIKKDEIIVDYENGPGKFISSKYADRLFAEGYDYMMQVGDNLFFAATNEREKESADFINHSCNPNCGFEGSFKIVAMREIRSGEEITIDYAMCESSNFKMKCLCRSDNCRKTITGDDWKIKKIQEKYKGYFSEYLKKKIGIINKETGLR